MKNSEHILKIKSLSHLTNIELRELEVKYIQIIAPPNISFYKKDSQCELFAIIAYDVIDGVLLLKLHNLTDFVNLLSSIGIFLRIENDMIRITDSKGRELENCSDECMQQHFISISQH